jgi:predicted protein tyrosine phosphatase
MISACTACGELGHVAHECQQLTNDIRSPDLPVDFNLAGRELLERMADSESSGKYSSVNAVWRADGGTVFVGSLQAAKDSGILRKHNIKYVVNCMNQPSHNIHSSVTYFNFPIEKWRDALIAMASTTSTQFEDSSSFKLSLGIRSNGFPFCPKEAALVQRFFEPVLDFINSATVAGGNVLIHCFAGAHRAGTTATAFLMHREGLGAEDAISTAQQLRPVIDPKLHAENFKLLQQLELAAKMDCTAAAGAGEAGEAIAAAAAAAAADSSLWQQSINIQYGEEPKGRFQFQRSESNAERLAEGSGDGHHTASALFADHHHTASALFADVGGSQFEFATAGGSGADVPSADAPA